MMINYSNLVYVFVGGQWGSFEGALYDFMHCLQERRLLDSGEYMVISVNDEFYNPERKSMHDGRQSE